MRPDHLGPLNRAAWPADLLSTFALQPFLDRRPPSDSAGSKPMRVAREPQKTRGILLLRLQAKVKRPWVFPKKRKPLTYGNGRTGRVASDEWRETNTEALLHVACLVGAGHP